MKDTERIVQAAREGAEKYNKTQFDLLKQFAAIDCGTYYEEGNAKIADIAEKCLKDIGAETERIYSPGVGTHILGWINKGNPNGKIIINSHLDTVFKPGDCEAHPYHEEGEWAYGLGVADCKGGFAVAVYAVKIMKDAGLLPDKEIEFIYNCDEETGSHEGRKIFEKESPGADMAFVFEPARLENGIITKRLGYAQIRVNVTGKEAHAANDYAKGASATLELAHKIIELKEMWNEEEGIRYNVDRMEGSRTSVVVAGSAWCEAGVSLSNPDSIQIVEKDMAELEKSTTVPGTSVKTEIDLLFPTMERNAANLSVYELVHKAGLLLGHDYPEQIALGPTDAGYFSCFGVPVVDGMGPYMVGIHTFNEHMRIDSVREKTELFAVTLGLI